jgi:hypothetical protein
VLLLSGCPSDSPQLNTCLKFLAHAYHGLMSLKFCSLNECETVPVQHAISRLLASGMDGSHRCNNPACVNPAHLVLECRELNNGRGTRCFTPVEKNKKVVVCQCDPDPSRQCLLKEDRIRPTV